MKHVRVSMTANGREAEVHPMYDVLANAPFVERATAMQWNFTEEGLSIVQYVVGDQTAFAAAIDDIDLVREYEIEPAGENGFYLYVLDEGTDLRDEIFGALHQQGIVIVPPMVFHRDGTVSLSLFGPPDQVQTVVDGIEPPMELSIEEIGGLSGLAAMADARLSERQREAVDAALDLGYYDVPRTASHEDVAAALDCAPSTAAEHLRKAESTLLRTVRRR